MHASRHPKRCFEAGSRQRVFRMLKAPSLAGTVLDMLVSDLNLSVACPRTRRARHADWPRT